MIPELERFLKETESSTSHFTHQSMFAKKKYNINGRYNETFLNLYREALEQEDVDILELGIGEPTKFLTNIPVLVDFDVKLKSSEATEYLPNKKVYTQEDLEEVVSIYQQVITELIHPECDTKEVEKALICVVLEKEPYSLEKGGIHYYKSGFHLHFPYAFFEKRLHKEFIIPSVKKMINEKKVLLDIFDEPASLIDAGYLSTPWLLYGSSKGRGFDPYVVTQILNSERDPISLESAFRGYQIHRLINDGKEEEMITLNTKKSIEDNLFRILSVKLDERPLIKVRRDLFTDEEKRVREERRREIDMSVENITANTEIISELIVLINEGRSCIHDDWIQIGWAIYNGTGGSDVGLDLWTKFSASSHHNDARCEREWLQMERRCYNYGIGTLRKFAGDDSPNEYKEWRDRYTRKHATNSIEGGQYDIAKLIYNEYSEIFVCASILGNTWYKFDGNIWHQMEDGREIRAIMSEKIYYIYDKVRRKIISDKSKAEEEDRDIEKMRLEGQLKAVKKIMTNLKNRNFKAGVLKECADVFFDENFKDKLDKDKNLFAFKNGVMDLKNMRFRRGRPQDYLSKQAPIHFVEYEGDEDEVMEFKTFLRRTFPDKEIYDYFMFSMADLFRGGNTFKKAYFWLGEGDNGKSIIQEMFEKMLGKYAIKFDTSLITGKKPNQGSTHAELARSGGGVRFVTLDEPNQGEEINSGTLKKITGSDKYFARDLFEKGKETTEIEPYYILNFICNKLPHVKGGNDKAFWNRSRVIPFESTFYPQTEAKEVPETEEEQMEQKKFFKENLDGKLDLYAPIMAWLLLHDYYRDHEPQQPEKVQVATKQYQMRTNITQQFIDEFIIDDPDSFTTTVFVYEKFKEWFRQSFPSTQVINKIDFDAILLKAWGEPERGMKGKYTGKKLCLEGVDAYLEKKRRKEEREKAGGDGDLEECFDSDFEGEWESVKKTGSTSSNK